MLVQIIDVDYIFNGDKPIIRIFGKTENNKSVCVFYDKFFPYFYAKTTTDKIPRIDELKEVKSLNQIKKFLSQGFHKDKTDLLKITLYSPQDVPVVRDRIINNGFAEDVFEADILFKYRFMVDHELKGLHWIDATCEQVQSQTIKIPSYYATDLKPVDKNENAKLKILSLDIECLPDDPKKPIDAKNNSIIMVSLSFSQAFGNEKSIVLVAKPFSGNGIRGFKDEKEMLEEFTKVIDNYDPDIITGYNINAFDMPYILERLRSHKLPTSLGRCRDKNAFTKTFGITTESIVPGRVVFDPYQILKRDPWVKFHRYDLGTVSKQMLNETKHDVAYKDMERLWNGTKKDTERLIEYARNDSHLNLSLIIKKGLLDKFIEICKISGSLLQDSFGGQTSRIETMILHEFKKRDFVMPSKPYKGQMIKRNKEKELLKGATVLEPVKGLHTDGCILVLDFKSLYPSIMRTFNISPDTVLVDDTKVEKHKSPTGASFVNETVRSGVFPDLLNQLMTARRNAKKEMKKAKGDLRRVLNARQLALKDISNSFYGYTGYARARLFMLDVANAITGYGRENIEKTKKFVNDKFGLEIVYGDTDSIFVKTRDTNLDNAKRLGEEISKYVTEELPGVLELEFEKVYRTFLILTKKRYVGWCFRYEDGWRDEIEMRGIETVRRDWCPLVSELLLDVINIIMKEGDVQKAMKIVKDCIENLKSGKIDIEKLTVIKGITKAPESYDGVLPHIELAKKLTIRNPQEPPRMGDRIGFVIIKGNQMLSKRAEDPSYAKEHALDIDADYYIHNQILPPIERIFSSINITKQELMGLGRQVSLDDIVNGDKRKMKHDIKVDFKNDTSKLSGWEEFICASCNKSYRRVPLSGICECGGELSISYHGSVGEKVVVK